MKIQLILTLASALAPPPGTKHLPPHLQSIYNTPHSMLRNIPKDTNFLQNWWAGTNKARARGVDKRSSPNTNSKYGFYINDPSRRSSISETWRSNIGSDGVGGGTGSHDTSEAADDNALGDNVSEEYPEEWSGATDYQLLEQEDPFIPSGSTRDAGDEFAVNLQSLEEIVTHLGLTTTFFLETLRKIVSAPSESSYSSIPQRVPRFGNVGPLFMRDFYDAVNTTEVYQPVSPSVYRRNLFPVSPKKPRHRPSTLDRLPARMDPVTLNGFDLDRHFPSLPSPQSDTSHEASSVPHDEGTSTDVVIIHDFGLPVGFGGLGWNSTPHKFVRIVTIVLDNEEHTLELGASARHIKTGEWFLVAPEQIASVEVDQCHHHTQGHVI